MFFNVTTYQAVHTAAGLAEVDLLLGVGRDRVSSVAPARAASRARGSGWWQPAVNLLGCIFFGISAIAGYVTSTGSILDQAAANRSTSLGAACFLACAVDTLHTGEAFKVPGFRRFRELENAVDGDVRRVI